MDVLLVSPTKEDAAADSKPPRPATPITCRHCGCCFAIISVEAGLVPFTQKEQVCAFCDPFLKLYETLRTKESEHTAFLDRGPRHHGRKSAHEQYRNARIALENFLLAVETPHQPNFGMTQAEIVNDVEHVQLERTDGPLAAQEHGDDQKALDEGPVRTGPASPTDSSTITKHKPKRKSDTSFVERKRIKFTETVEERSQYRSTDEFNRGAKGYVPGRYVAAEGTEFLDTSGSTLSFAKFTGQKKMGSGFVDIVPKADFQEGENAPSRLLKEERGKNKTQGREAYHETRQSARQTENRELRASRRPRSVKPSATARPRRTAAQFDGHYETHTRSSGRPPLIVALKYSPGIEADAIKKVEQSAQVSKHLRQSTLDGDYIEPAGRSTEIASIKDIVTNIQGELSHLQEVAVSSGYKDLVLAAVRGFAHILEPLIALNDTEPGLTETNEGVIDGGGAFEEATTATSHEIPSSILYPVVPVEGGKGAVQESFAATAIRGLENGDVSLAPDTNSLSNVLLKDELNAPGIALHATTRASRDTETMSPSASFSTIYPPPPSVDQTSLRACPSSTSSGRSTHSSVSKHGDHVEATPPPHSEVAKISPIHREPPLQDCAPGTTGDENTSSDDHGTAHQRPNPPAEPTLAALQVQSSRFEVAEGMHHHFVDWTNGGDQEHASLAQHESVPEEDRSSSSIGQTLGTAHVGSSEATGKVEMHMTDTDRRGAGKEAQVGPDTAHNPAEADTADSRGLPAESSDENNTGEPPEDQDYALEPSYEHRPALRNDNGEANGNKARIGFLVSHYSIATNGGGQNETFTATTLPATKSTT
ncbi:hypothetical protein SVAN01_10211 [Stagonosporopsis vannaccii]|nr:hypothetical protein SVAN01_10211 [Stagonosporopsis vannaccii]